MASGIELTHEAILVLADTTNKVHITQQGIAAVAQTPTAVRNTQAAMMVIGGVATGLEVTMQAVLLLAENAECVTQRCQLWKITRRDGTVFTFTSLDQDVHWGDGLTYKSCNSLVASANASSSTMGSVGDITLNGIIDDEDISEADLYGGLFDDAYVEVWLVSWGRKNDRITRLAAGWAGNLSQSEQGFAMDVLGPGARLGQQAIVETFQPGCRWSFGSVECGVDLEALKQTFTVEQGQDRAHFTADLASDGSAHQWADGTVKWTSGPNIGQICEVKSADFSTGEITLWALTALVPTAGDTFDLRPGCDKQKLGGCQLYNNIARFGGFAEVPGQDALLARPVSTY